jgi:hypothetical protein
VARVKAAVAAECARMTALVTSDAARNTVLAATNVVIAAAEAAQNPNSDSTFLALHTAATVAVQAGIVAAREAVDAAKIASLAGMLNLRFYLLTAVDAGKIMALAGVDTAIKLAQTARCNGVMQETSAIVALRVSAKVVAEAARVKAEVAAECARIGAELAASSAKEGYRVASNVAAKTLNTTRYV